MGWIPYPTALNGYSLDGQPAQNQQNPAGPLNGYGSAAHLSAIAMSQMPHTSLLASLAQGLAGYMGGRADAQEMQQLDQGVMPLGRKSDRRLKSDVVRVGTLKRIGLPLYAYRLEGSPLFEVGCMADEVALVCPDATWFDRGDGFARVVYERLI